MNHRSRWNGSLSRAIIAFNSHVQSCIMPCHVGSHAEGVKNQEPRIRVVGCWGSSNLSGCLGLALGTSQMGCVLIGAHGRLASFMRPRCSMTSNPPSICQLFTAYQPTASPASVKGLFFYRLPPLLVPHSIFYFEPTSTITAYSTNTRHIVSPLYCHIP